jgi:hypothetical protein
MARSTLSPPRVLRAIVAAVAVVVLTAGPAVARPDPSAGPRAHPAAAAAATAAPIPCQSADLGISVPAAIAGDPDQGMGKQAWNIVFRNVSKTAC